MRKYRKIFSDVRISFGIEAMRISSGAVFTFTCETANPTHRHSEEMRRRSIDVESHLAEAETAAQFPAASAMPVKTKPAPDSGYSTYQIETTLYQ